MEVVVLGQCVEFGKIATGRVFEYKGNYYQKTDAVEDDGRARVVNLFSGATCWFGSEEKVNYCPDAKVVIGKE